MDRYNMEKKDEVLGLVIGRSDLGKNDLASLCRARKSFCSCCVQKLKTIKYTSPFQHAKHHLHELVKSVLYKRQYNPSKSKKRRLMALFRVEQSFCKLFKSYIWNKITVPSVFDLVISTVQVFHPKDIYAISIVSSCLNRILISHFEILNRNKLPLESSFSWYNQDGKYIGFADKFDRSGEHLRWCNKHYIKKQIYYEVPLDKGMIWEYNNRIECSQKNAQEVVTSAETIKYTYISPFQHPPRYIIYAKHHLHELAKSVLRKRQYNASKSKKRRLMALFWVEQSFCKLFKSYIWNKITVPSVFDLVISTVQVFHPKDIYAISLVSPCLYRILISNFEILNRNKLPLESSFSWYDQDGKYIGFADKFDRSGEHLRWCNKHYIKKQDYYEVPRDKGMIWEYNNRIECLQKYAQEDVTSAEANMRDDASVRRTKKMNKKNPTLVEADRLWKMELKKRKDKELEQTDLPLVY